MVLTPLTQDNTISDDGAGALVAALEQNDSLTTLLLSVRLLERGRSGDADTTVQGNPIDVGGIMALGTALAQNGSLQHWNLAYVQQWRGKSTVLTPLAQGNGFGAAQRRRKGRS